MSRDTFHLLIKKLKILTVPARKKFVRQNKHLHMVQT